MDSTDTLKPFDGVDFDLAPENDPEFMAAWFQMQRRGYQWSEGNIAKAHLGWVMARNTRPTVESEPVAGWIVGNANADRWRTWNALGFSAWTEERDKATRYARREDAEAVHAADEDAWRVEPYTHPAPPADAVESGLVGIGTLVDYRPDTSGWSLPGVVVDHIEGWVKVMWSDGSTGIIRPSYVFPTALIEARGEE